MINSRNEMWRLVVFALVLAMGGYVAGTQRSLLLWLGMTALFCLLFAPYLYEDWFKGRRKTSDSTSPAEQAPQMEVGATANGVPCQTAAHGVTKASAGMQAQISPPMARKPGDQTLSSDAVPASQAAAPIANRNATRASQAAETPQAAPKATADPRVIPNSADTAGAPAEQDEPTILSADHEELSALASKGVQLTDAPTENGILVRWPAGARDVVVPGHVLGIGPRAFKACASTLRSVRLPEGLSIISDYAFEDCKLLESVDIPASVRGIGKCAFANCRNLRSVTLHEGPLSVGNWAFLNCESLASVTMPQSIEKRGKDIFQGCPHLPQTNASPRTEAGNAHGLVSWAKTRDYPMDSHPFFDAHASRSDAVVRMMEYFASQMGWVEERNRWARVKVVKNYARTSIKSGPYSFGEARDGVSVSYEVHSVSFFDDGGEVEESSGCSIRYLGETLPPQHATLVDASRLEALANGFASGTKAAAASHGSALPSRFCSKDPLGLKGYYLFCSWND